MRTLISDDDLWGLFGNDGDKQGLDDERSEPDCHSIRLEDQAHFANYDHLVGGEHDPSVDRSLEEAVSFLGGDDAYGCKEEGDCAVSDVAVAHDEVVDVEPPSTLMKPSDGKSTSPPISSSSSSCGDAPKPGGAS